MTDTNPFEALGLPADPSLGDEQVRAAWRQVAGATHPDRADGGDLARYTAASAAYAELRTAWGRSEAYADLTERADGPVTAPIPVILGSVLPPPAPPWQPLLTLAQVPARIIRGRPLHLLLRAVIAAVLVLVILQLTPGTAAAPADILGVMLWFVLTGRRDLAPRPER